jgi:ribose transport system permease protein
MMNARDHRGVLLAFVAAAALLLLTTIVAPGFLAVAHLRSLAVLSTFIGIVALGQTFVIIGGGIDLSVPWVLNGAAVFVTWFAHGHNHPLYWAVPLILGSGALIGAINGFGIAAIGVPAIVMTLAVNVILQGTVLITTGGAPTAAAPPAIQFLAVGRFAGIPVVLVIWAILTLASTVLLSKTAFGRYLYALGTSATVARFSGVPTIRTAVISYTLCGFTAALAGILLTGYSGQAYLGMGDPYLFTSIAAVAIGGTSILGGSGSYTGTIAGAIILTTLTGLLPALRLSNGALQIIYGIVILMTVALSSDKVSALLVRRSRIPESIS